jgi:hypothetical protein
VGGVKDNEESLVECNKVEEEGWRQKSKTGKVGKYTIERKRGTRISGRERRRRLEGCEGLREAH